MVKNKLNKKLGRVGAGLLSALLIAGTYSTKTVYADDNIYNGFLNKGIP